MLTRTDRKQIDRAIAIKKSSPYVQGYEAAIREMQMLAASGKTVQQIVEAMSKSPEAGA
jgi:hypothetical protein